MPYLFDALCDLAELALGCQSCKTRPPSEVAPREMRLGGLVYLSGSGVALHVGVMAAPDHCRVLAGRLLGRSLDELSDDLVNGAIRELAYLVAGGVRRRLRGGGKVSVGQPCLVEGNVDVWPGWLAQTTEAELDGIPLTLIWLSETYSAAARACG
jgi:hypothetical protein